jgi:hypothetical protein
MKGMAQGPDCFAGVPRRISFSSADFDVDTKPLDREALKHLVQKAEPSNVEVIDVHVSVVEPPPAPIVLVAPPSPLQIETVRTERPRKTRGFVATVCTAISIGISFLLVLAMAAGVSTFVVH